VQLHNQTHAARLLIPMSCFVCQHNTGGSPAAATAGVEESVTREEAGDTGSNTQPSAAIVPGK
jgi:hypothetical protein